MNASCISKLFTFCATVVSSFVPSTPLSSFNTPKLARAEKNLLNISLFVELEHTEAVSVPNVS